MKRREQTRTSLGRARLALLTAAGLAVLTAGVAGAASSTTRVSVDSSGGEANAPSIGPSISADGRYVAYLSDATNLVPGDTNGMADVFVHDRQTGQTTRANVNDSEEQATGEANADITISPDGRFVTFTSDASNLVPGDTNGVRDVFVRDRQVGETVRASVSGSGLQANGTNVDPKLSAGGRYVVFQSWASNLVANDTNDFSDILVKDLQTGEVVRASVDNSGGQATGGLASLWPSISHDGRYVSFVSNATNLVANDTNGMADVFVRDLREGSTQRVNLNGSGEQADSESSDSSISADGRHVTFRSFATNLVAGDTNNEADVFVRDRQTGQTVRANVGDGGGQAAGTTDDPEISPDGRHVVFESDAANLVAGDTNNLYDVFVRDLQANRTVRVNVDGSGGQVFGRNVGFSINSNARHVAFGSGSGAVVAGDTNNTYDIFVRQLDPAPLPQPDLAASSDTGSSGTDNVTNDRTPTFGGTAEAGTTVEILVDGVPMGSATADSNGLYSVTTGVIADGAHAVTARTTDGTGGVGEASPPLGITVDTGPPAITGAPRHGFVAPSTVASSLASSTVPVDLSWSGADGGGGGGSGIAGYEVQRSLNGGAFATVASPTNARLSQKLTPGTNSYRYQVRARDRAGNVGAFVAGPAFRVSAYQESSPKILDTGAWTTAAQSGAYGGSVQYANTAGKRVSITLPSGTRNVAWVSTRNKDLGLAEVYLDGVFQRRVDLYSASFQPRQVVLGMAVSPTTTHKLEVRVLGKKQAASSGTWVDVDALLSTQ